METTEVLLHSCQDYRDHQEAEILWPSNQDDEANKTLIWPLKEVLYQQKMFLIDGELLLLLLVEETT